MNVHTVLPVLLVLVVLLHLGVIVIVLVAKGVKRALLTMGSLVFLWFFYLFPSGPIAWAMDRTTSSAGGYLWTLFFVVYFVGVPILICRRLTR